MRGVGKYHRLKRDGMEHIVPYWCFYHDENVAILEAGFTVCD